MMPTPRGAKDPSGGGGKRAAGVEAIFLTADPEEEGGSSAGQELWRQTNAGQQSAVKGFPPSPGKDVGSRAGSIRVIPDQAHPVSIKQQDRPAPVAPPSPRAAILQRNRSDPASPPVPSWRNPLRKSRSVSDVDADGSEEKTSTSRMTSSATSSTRRRMSVSVTQYTMSSRDDLSSRRSSAASIIISLSRPDSPQPRILTDGDEADDGNISPESQTTEFLRIRGTATAVHVATRFRNDTTLHPERGRYQPGGFRRNSSPTVPKLNFNQQQTIDPSIGSPTRPPDENKAPSKRPTSADAKEASRVNRRRSSTSSVQHAYYMPASRPSSAMEMMAGMDQSQSRPSSSATIRQLGKVSRPWTPARSPSAGSNNMPGMGPGGRNMMLMRSRTPASMAAPLQALNAKVSNILGCAANILDFYHVQSDSKKETEDPRRNARLLKSMQMNMQQMPASESAEERLAKFRRLQANERKKEQSLKLGRHQHPRPLIGRSKKLSKLSAQIKAKSEASESIARASSNPVGPSAESGDKVAPLRLPPSFALTKDSSATSDGGSATSASTGRSKGIALLKSLMSKRGTVSVAAAFTGKSLPLPAKAKISKAIKRNKSNFKMRLSKQQQQQNAANANQGPPTLVNFFKRGQQRGNKKDNESRAPIKYETFTDKDRAAAVLLGDADIKTTLEKQLKSERGRYVLPKESPAQVYLAQADFEMRIGGLSTAKGLLDKALELQPGDKAALCSRSKCRLMMGDTKGALDDAEEALADGSQCVKAMYQKAEVLFQMGRFEEALVFYHMGSKQRPDMELFHQGVRKAQEAIEVSLGVKQPTLQQQQQHRSTLIPRKKKPGDLPASMTSSRLPPLNLSPSGGKPSSSMIKGQQPSSHRETSLLGDLHVDKLYLEKLLQNPGLRHASVPSQKIINHAKETLEYLKTRENFWRQQQPSTINYAPALTTKLGRKIKKRKRAPTSQKNSCSNSSGSSGSVRRDVRSVSSSNVSQAANETPESLTERAVSSSHTGDFLSQEGSQYGDDDEVERTRRAEGNGLTPDDDAHREEMRQIIARMTEHSERKQLNCCVDIYMKKCWRGPEGEEDLTDEIEEKMGELQLLDQQPNENDDEARQRRAVEKSNMALEIAMWYLANGQEDLADTSAQQCLLLAREAGEPDGLIQVYLLLAALAALSGDPASLEEYLNLARQTLDGSSGK